MEKIYCAEKRSDKGMLKSRFTAQLALASVCSIGAAIAPGTASAGPMVLNDQATFDTLVAGGFGSMFSEGFESAALGQNRDGSPSLVFADLVLSSSRFTVEDSERFVTEGNRAIKAVPGGWGSSDPTWTPSYNDYGPVTFSFLQPIHFLGFDVSDLGSSQGQSVLRASLDSADPVELLRQGDPFNIDDTGCGSDEQQCNDDMLGSFRFVGLLSDTPFSSIEIDLVEGEYDTPGGFVKDDYVGFDNLRYGGAANSIPSPASGLLLALGGALLLLCRRLRPGRREP